MAKISLNQKAPGSDGKVRVTLGSTDFTLEGDGVFETNDPEVVAAAANNPLFDVTVEAAQVEVEKQDQTDPHINPRADHLVAGADEEVVKKAEENQERIRESIDPLNPDAKLGWPGTEVTGTTEAQEQVEPPKAETAPETTEVHV